MKSPETEYRVNLAGQEVYFLRSSTAVKIPMVRTQCVLSTKSQIYIELRACLHGGGGPQVGEVTRLAVVEEWPRLHAKLQPRDPGVTLPDVVANVT